MVRRPRRSDSEFASANDTGPANLITEDPTCEAWGRISRELSTATKAVDWAERDDSVPADAWDPDLRAAYEAAGRAMSNAAEGVRALVSATPHRVMRELYGQFNTFTNGVVEKIPTYTAADSELATMPTTIASALSSICDRAR